MEIVDAHIHIGDLSNISSHFGDIDAKELPADSPPFDMDSDIAARVRALDAFGIAWAIVQPSHAYLRPEGIKDTMRVNDQMAEYRRRCPSRFPVALGTVEPLHGSRSLGELERIKHELKLDGVSWHHRMSGCKIDSKWMWPILRKMRELSRATVIHTMAESNFEAAWQLQRLAKAFPDMGFLALDAFCGVERGNQVYGTAAETPNILWDIGGPVSYMSVAQWVKRNGSKTICFSGAALYPVPAGAKLQTPRLLQELDETSLADTERADILALNVRRLFGLPLDEAPLARRF